MHDSRTPGARIGRQPLGFLGRTDAQFASTNQQLQAENRSQICVIKRLNIDESLLTYCSSCRASRRRIVPAARRIQSSPRRTDCRVQEKVSMQVRLCLALVRRQGGCIRRPCLKSRVEVCVVNDGFGPKFILRNSNPNGWVNGDSLPCAAIWNAMLTHSLDVVYFRCWARSKARRWISVSNQMLSVCAHGSSSLRRSEVSGKKHFAEISAGSTIRPDIFLDRGGRNVYDRSSFFGATGRTPK